MSESWQAGVLAVAMVLLAIVALATPRIMFDDEPGTATPEHLRRLRVQARKVTTIPPLRMQITEATVTGPTPDHVAGTVLFRGPFGVEWAELEIGERAGTYHWHHGRWFATWGAFLGGEGILLAVLARRLWTMP